MSKRSSRNDGWVSATQLAEMGFCEKKILLARHYGERSTSAQRKARARGLAAHERYLAEGRAAATDRRCFVATYVFGPDARETQVLRAYRDAVLLRRLWGRALVAAYYRIAPIVCRLMERSPVTVRGVRRMLCIAVACCETALGVRRLP